jgi:hypothetical protein
MILPGLISVAFYRRHPSTMQIGLGAVFTVALSGLLGYIQDAGTPRVWENVALAIVGGVVLYVAVLAYLIYRYFPKRAKAAEPPTTSASVPPH